MLHKTHTVKGKTTVSRKDNVCMRVWATEKLGEKFAPSLDSFWRKNDTMTRSTWEYSSGDCVAIHLVNDIPVLLAYFTPGADVSSLKSAVMAPTLFFLFLVRNYYKGEDLDVASLFGPSVFCRGPTSQFILSGAHLMMPGIVHVSDHDQKPLKKGDLVFVYSVGNCWPYAAGLATDNLGSFAKQGRGVDILHSYKDSMWNEFFEHFYASSMCLKSVLPATFGDVEVAEVSPEVILLTNSFDAKETSQNTEGNQEVGGEDFSNNKESILRSAFELLRDDDERLNFALCEAVKLLKPSAFPLPLTEFAPLMFSNYPRYPGVDMRVEIKNTRYKKILNYLLLNSDLITVNEEKPGVFVVTHVNKSSDLLRMHKEKFEEFLRWFCYPAKEEESLKEEQQAFQDCKRLAFKRRIVSVEGLLSLQNREPMEVRRLLCVGRVDGKTDEGLVLGDEELMDNLHSQKDICRNLRNYIAENNLLQTSNQQKALPLVDLKLALACFSKTSDEKVTIVELERLVLRRVFVPVWKITLETTPLNNGVATSKVAITHLHKKGELEKISLRTEKRAGNKVVTVVRGLEEYGFDLQSVANDWKHLFSTSCIINDSSKDNMRLKNGKKIPREIHLCGDWISKLQSVLKTHLGFPQHLIP